MFSLTLLAAQPLLPLIALPILVYGGVIGGEVAQMFALGYVYALILRQIHHRRVRLAMIVVAQIVMFGYVCLQ